MNPDAARLWELTAYQIQIETWTCVAVLGTLSAAMLTAGVLLLRRGVRERDLDFGVPGISLMVIGGLALCLTVATNLPTILNPDYATAARFAEKVSKP